MTLASLTANLGRGLAAGLVGTAAMTVSSTAEAKLRDRGSSTTPAAAGAAVLGVVPRDERGERRFNHIMHWGYGTSLGAVRGMLASTGMGPRTASVAHLATVLGAEQVVLPATGAAPPATRWEAKEVAIDVLHHAVYAAATGAAYAWLTRH